MNLPCDSWDVMLNANSVPGESPVCASSLRAQWSLMVAELLA